MLLSHHPPSQYCRTYNVIGIRLCARCLGIPLGILAAYIFELKVPIWGLFILPLPTFLNFLLQELGCIKKRNIVKTFLTLFLGIYVYDLFQLFVIGDYILGALLIGYLFALELQVAYLLNKKNKLEPLIQLYEEGIKTKDN